MTVEKFKEIVFRVLAIFLKKKKHQKKKKKKKKKKTFFQIHKYQDWNDSVQTFKLKDLFPIERDCGLNAHL